MGLDFPVRLLLQQRFYESGCNTKDSKQSSRQRIGKEGGIVLCMITNHRMLDWDGKSPELQVQLCFSLRCNSLSIVPRQIPRLQRIAFFLLAVWFPGICDIDIESP